ncbi:MAG TPA: ATP-binding cassette domain-containing protein [Thermoleophilia bacterium]|nr:ATP-binding cassette domain-containing protein [Thermoleophilia bacterium]
MDTLRQTEKQVERGGASEAVIEVRDLVKVYGRDTRALDGITFDVGHGELFGFLGPNGAGKTTTIRILATLLRPTSGVARVAGFDVATHPNEVRKRLGLAMQTPTLDQFSTGRETLELAGRLHRLPPGQIKSRADELLELMGLSGVAKKLTGTYSGGMKRRLDLASALMHRPSLLILDEPTEGLDPQSRTALWEELERIGAEGTTMLLTTHYMEEADRLCSRLAIVDNGRIVVEGGPAELKETVGADSVVLQLEPGDTGDTGATSDAADTGGNGGNGHAEDRVATVCRLLENMLPCEAVTPHPAGVTLAVPNASEAVPRLMRRLDGNGLRITGLQMTQPSLDDVFLKYTGRHIREESADQPIIIGW